jgi:hypothetical protein
MFISLLQIWRVAVYLMEAEKIKKKDATQMKLGEE